MDHPDEPGDDDGHRLWRLLFPLRGSVRVERFVSSSASFPRKREPLFNGDGGRFGALARKDIGTMHTHPPHVTPAQAGVHPGIFGSSSTACEIWTNEESVVGWEEDGQLLCSIEPRRTPVTHQWYHRPQAFECFYPLCSQRP